MSGSPYRMSGSPTECSVVDGWLSWMSGSGREALPDVREWSEVSRGSLGVVGWPSRMAESGREAFPDVRE